MTKILYKLAQTKACIIALQCMANAIKIRLDTMQQLAMYGKHYKNTLGHDATELRIKWLEFKALFLIETFRLSNAEMEKLGRRPDKLPKN